MKQADLHRQIAKATGETIAKIRSMGFSLEQAPEDIEGDHGDGDSKAESRRGKPLAKLFTCKQMFPALQIMAEAP